jgi:hypothetical protein
VFNKVKSHLLKYGRIFEPHFENTKNKFADFVFRFASERESSDNLSKEITISLFDGVDDKEYFLEPTLEFRRKISDSKKSNKG